MGFFGRKIKNNQFGFTLIELLVSVFIIALISGLTLAGHFAGQRVYKVSQAAQELTSNLRRAQTLALAGNTQNSAKGFGIYVDAQNFYLLFYNTGASRLYQPPESQPIERIYLAGGLKFSQTGSSAFFTPPDPTTFFNGSPGANGEFIIQSSDNAIQKTVKVEGNGRIEIN